MREALLLARAVHLVARAQERPDRRLLEALLAVALVAHRAHLAGSLRSAGSSAGAPTAAGAKGDTSAPSGRLPALASALVLGNAEHVAATRVSTPCVALDASSDIDSPCGRGWRGRRSARSMGRRIEIG